MADVILVLNAGSSSIKFSVFGAGGESAPLVLRGQIEGLYTAPRRTGSYTVTASAGGVKGTATVTVTP